MTIKVNIRRPTTITVGQRWVSEPGIVLSGYLLLGIVILLAPGSLLRVSLAAILLLVGLGYSLVAVLFPRPTELNGVERAALAGCLSLAVVGVAGFLLNYSLWGYGWSLFWWQPVCLIWDVM